MSIGLDQPLAASSRISIPEDVHTAMDNKLPEGIAHADPSPSHALHSIAELSRSLRNATLAGSA